MTATVHTLHKDWESRKSEELSELLKDRQNRYRSKSLFIETAHPDYPSIFTLKDKDYKGHKSLYRIYMDIADPTEYQVAERCLGSWQHWKHLCECSWFKPIVNEWREELELRIRSSVKGVVEDLAYDETVSDGTRLQALKWLGNKGYKERAETTSPARKRGRPSKDDIEEELKKELRKHSELAEDFDRVFNTGD